VEVFDYAAHVLSEEFAKNRYRCDSCLEFLDRHGGVGLDVLAGPLYWRLAVVQTPEGDQYVERLTRVIVAGIKAASFRVLSLAAD
jgi:hypothetical protein